VKKRETATEEAIRVTNEELADRLAFEEAMKKIDPFWESLSSALKIKDRLIWAAAIKHAKGTK